MNSAEMRSEFEQRIRVGEYEEALRFIAPSIGSMLLQTKWKKAFKDAFLVTLRLNYSSSNPKDLSYIGLVNNFIKSFKSDFSGPDLTDIENKDINTLKIACQTMNAMNED